MNSILPWLKGLIAAFISAAANSLTAAVVAPESFNFGSQWKHTATLALVGGIVSAAAYLKQSPLPETQKIEVK